MKNIFICSLCFMVLSGCGSHHDTYLLKGRITGVTDSTKIYLYFTSGDVTVVDSAYTADGNFSFRGAIDLPLRATLSSGLTPDYVAHDVKRLRDQKGLYLEPGEIIFHSTDSLRKGHVSGTASNDDQNRWREISNGLNNREDKLSLALDFIESNPDSFFALDMLYGSFFDLENIEPTEEIFNIFTARIKSTERARFFNTYIQNVKATLPGCLAPDFTMTDTEENTIRLSDFRGQYILLDFWASWCGPCRKENPYLVAAHDQFSDNGFTVLSVSMDEDKKTWLEAIRKDNLMWTNVSELTGWKSSVARLYGVRSIPSNFLIDPQGIIVAKNLRGEQLMEQLNQHLRH